MYPALLAATHAHHTSEELFTPLDKFPAQNEVMTWCQNMSVGTSILLMVMGVVYLLYGWSMFKALITLNAAMVGAYIGATLGYRAGGYTLAGGAVGAVIAAGAAWPLIKWAVAVIGGLCGAIVGGMIWMAAGLPQDMAWAGALTGLVGFGLFSFILFRGSIIAYTSLQGSMMLVIGLLGIAFKWPEVAPSIHANLVKQPLALPIAILIPAILGLIFQQTHSGGGGGGGAPAKAPEKK